MMKYISATFIFLFLLISVLTPDARAVFADATPAVNQTIGQNTSQNWAGYVSTGGTYTAVSATWTVPTPAVSSTPTTADATWVGIGGMTSHDLIQSGTQVIMADGVPTYTAWVEVLPSDQINLPVAVHGGDSVSVSLSEQSTNNWLVSFTNNTTGQNYETTIAYTSSHSSAEWVEEMPLGVVGRRASFIPLDNFGTIQFQNAQTTMNGATVDITGSNAQPMTMITSANSALATPSDISNGSSFSVTRTSVSLDQNIVSPYGGQTGPGRQFGRTGNGVQGYVPRSRMQMTRRGFFQNFSQFSQRMNIIFIR